MEPPKSPPTYTRKAVCPPTPHPRRPKAPKADVTSAPTKGTFIYMGGIYGQRVVNKIIRGPKVEVGHGDYGRVFETTYESKVVAVEISKPMEEEEVNQAINSVVLHRQIPEHRNVVPLLGACGFDKKIYRIMPMYSSSWSHPSLQLVEDMANALIHLKEHHLVHGDIKPSNIVWDVKTNVYVLVDLDLLNTCGTKVEEFGAGDYLAKEVCRSGILSYAGDTYALGVVARDMGFNLFGGKMTAREPKERSSTFGVFDFL